MTRLKRGSSVLAEAQKRVAGMHSISETLDFGDGLNLSTYDAKIASLDSQVSTYNNLLGALDKITGEIALAEQELKTLSGKMLMGVAVRYGKTSWEYGEAGGTNSLQRRKVESKTTPDQPAPSLAVAETNGKATSKTLQ
jgi:hypothetical protein